MTATVATSRPVLEAVATMLRLVTGKLIGDGKAPNATPPAALPVLPYAWVEGIGGVQLDGPPLGDQRHGDGFIPFQVNCVGGTPGFGGVEANWMADAVRVALLDKGGGHYLHALDVFGFWVMERDYLGSGPPIQDGKMVTVAEQFGVWITPRG